VNFIISDHAFLPIDDSIENGKNSRSLIGWMLSVVVRGSTASWFYEAIQRGRHHGYKLQQLKSSLND